MRGQGARASRPVGSAQPTRSAGLALRRPAGGDGPEARAPTLRMLREPGSGDDFLDRQRRVDHQRVLPAPPTSPAGSRAAPAERSARAEPPAAPPARRDRRADRRAARRRSRRAAPRDTPPSAPSTRAPRPDLPPRTAPARRAAPPATARGRRRQRLAAAHLGAVRRRVQVVGVDERRRAAPRAAADRGLTGAGGAHDHDRRRRRTGHGGGGGALSGATRPRTTAAPARPPSSASRRPWSGGRAASAWSARCGRGTASGRGRSRRSGR